MWPGLLSFTSWLAWASSQQGGLRGAGFLTWQLRASGTKDQNIRLTSTAFCWSSKWLRLAEIPRQGDEILPSRGGKAKEF